MQLNCLGIYRNIYLSAHSSVSVAGIEQILEKKVATSILVATLSFMLNMIIRPHLSTIARQNNSNKIRIGKKTHHTSMGTFGVVTVSLSVQPAQDLLLSKTYALYWRYVRTFPSSSHSTASLLRISLYVYGPLCVTFGLFPSNTSCSFCKSNT